MCFIPEVMFSTHPEVTSSFSFIFISCRMRSTPSSQVSSTQAALILQV